jgi:diguanylate cyclase (GGDEF)-like protein
MSASPPQARAHRIARVNYPPRALSFVGAFIAIVLLAPEHNFGWGILLFAVLSFLAYPHLAFVHAIRAADSKRAELVNLLVDSALLGTWVALAGFNLWLTFALLSATLINNALVGGPRHLGLAAVCFLASSLIVVMVGDISFQPSARLGVTLYIFGLSMVYLLAIGITSHTLNDRLINAHRDLVRNSRVFSSLLDLTIISNQATGVNDLLDRALDHFHHLEPDRPFALFLFKRKRPRQLISSDFRGIEASDWDDILDRVVKHNESARRDEELTMELSGQRLLAVPLLGQLERASGYVVTASDLVEELGKLLQLFIDQLAAALQNKLLTEHLRKAAETDSLTGLYNRRHLEQQLAKAIALKHRHQGQDFCIVMLDLVGLKRINDSLGHEAGDRLITTVASRLLKQARSTDVLARVGGDEFVLLCHDCRESNAVGLADRLIEGCRLTDQSSQNGDADPVEQAIEISVGVAGSDCHPPERVMEVADNRMYEHKSAYYRHHKKQR